MQFLNQQQQQLTQQALQQQRQQQQLAQQQFAQQAQLYQQAHQQAQLQQQLYLAQQQQLQQLAQVGLSPDLHKTRGRGWKRRSLRLLCAPCRHISSG